MRWQTETEIAPLPIGINHNEPILLMGSCFAENIGEKLSHYKFETIQNPFGIIYNPVSLAENMCSLLGAKTYTLADLSFANHRYYSYHHHSRFSHAQPEVALQHINHALAIARANLHKTKVAIISLGSAFYWRLRETGAIVNNCHKQPSQNFTQQLGSLPEVVDALQKTLTLLRAQQPDIKVVFTVSPVRHLKHGSHLNQLSKSTLLLAVQEVAATRDWVFYFPSYELLLDDLRDYRWYEADLIHPNAQAIEYIWEKFCNAAIAPTAQKALPKIAAMRKMLAHRMFAESKDARTAWLAKMQSKANQIKADFGLDFSAELTAWVDENLVG